jgi:hypothetical protein
LLLQAVVRLLVPHNPHLFAVDGTSLTAADIAAAYSDANKWTESQRRAYVAKLTLLMSIATAEGLPVACDGMLSHAPDDVAVGVQYEPAQVR